MTHADAIPKDFVERLAVQGDGKGFPDLVLIRLPRLVIAELKVGRNKPTPEQELWLQDFAWITPDVYVWYPSDWPTIEQVLSR